MSTPARLYTEYSDPRRDEMADGDTASTKEIAFEGFGDNERNVSQGKNRELLAAIVRQLWNR